MDPGKFAGVAKAFEFRVDQAAALAEANGRTARRYLHLSEPKGGLVHLEGRLDAEGGALVDLARRPLWGSKLGSTGAMRPHLVITASVESLAGVPGAPAAELRRVGPIANQTVQRHACDGTVSWLLANAEMGQETSHEHRRIPPSIRRALVARDKDCVFNGCHRPPDWCDGHHLQGDQGTV